MTSLLDLLVSNVAVLSAIRLVEFAVLSALAWTFCLAYHFKTGGEWHKNHTGRHLMRFTAVIGIICSFTVFLLVFGPPLHRGVALAVYVCVFAALIVEMANRIRLLLLSEEEDK